MSPGSNDSEKRRKISRAIGRFIGACLLLAAFRLENGWLLMLNFSWLIVLLFGAAFVWSIAASARCLHLDRSLLDNDQEATHTKERTDRLLANRGRDKPILPGIFLLILLVAVSVSVTWWIDRADVFLGMGLLTAAVSAALPITIAVRHFAQYRFMAAITAKTDRLIAQSRRESAAAIGEIRDRAKEASNAREEMAARLAIMRRDGLVGGERLRDSFDL